MSERPRPFERRPEHADEPPLPVWPSFLEKLLLTIIDAHPADGRLPRDRAADPDRQKRLTDALAALIGHHPPRGNRHLYLLHAAVTAADHEMPRASAAAFEKICLGLAAKERTRAPSKRETFARHADLMPGLSPESRQKRLKAFEKKNRDYLQHVALLRDHPEEQDMLKDMLAIASILKRWNIECAIEPEALGLASLWGRK